MKIQPIFSIFGTVFAVSLIILSAGKHVFADTQLAGSIDSFYKKLPKRLETGVKGSIRGWHYYYKDGFHIDSLNKKLGFDINGRIFVDGGNINADNELQIAFPDLDGSNILFRKLDVSIYGNMYDAADFKIEFDFANARDIQDNWIRFLKYPYFDHVKIGHQREPFSLEYLTSINWISFMERSLPVRAFSLSRNIGIRYDSLRSDKRINWGAGVFLNTGSFSTLGEAGDRISEANGFDLTARVFALPLFEENGKRMLHIGLGYSYGSRDENHLDAPMLFATRPESRLTDNRLVSSGPIAGKRRDTFSAELATVSGALFFQGECFYLSTDADAKGDPNFWGYYMTASYFLTGEYRKYNQSRGVFIGIEPRPRFRPRHGHWGALELALRNSYVDLNDGEIKGGKESNVWAGFNWYHSRNVRLMLNYIYAYVKERASPSVENGRSHIFQSRLQFIW